MIIELMVLHMSEIMLYKGIEFKIIPNWTSYAISKCQRIINRFNRNEKKWGVMKPNPRGWGGGYRYTRLVSDAGKSQCMLRHRLMLMAWRPIPNSSNMVVNHKNGVPGDDHLDNLEWCTRLENNRHALNTGLCSNRARAILVKDVLTGVIKRYPSMSHLGKALGMKNGSVIQKRMSKNVKQVYPDLLQYKFDDNSEWPAISQSDIDHCRKGVMQDICAKNVLTGESIIFNGCAAGEKILGIKAATILRHVRLSAGTPINGFCFRYLYGPVTYPEFTAYQKEVIKHFLGKRIGHGVLVTCGATGKETFYASIDLAAQGLLIQRREIINLCAYKKQMNNLKFEYIRVND